jgi:inositol transport system permease protein
MIAARGAALIVCDGVPLALNKFDSSSFKFIGQGRIGVIPIAVMLLLLIYVVTWLLLNKLPFGRHVYAIGGNEEAADASGINTKKVKIIAYVLAGLFSGIAGFVLMSRLNVGMPTAGVGYEFDAIIAVILGGVSFRGGTGNIWGTLIGAIIIGVLNNILNLMDVTSYIQQIVKGVIIVLAVIVDLKTKTIKVNNR